MTTSPLHTFSGEPRSTVPLSGNGTQLPTVDQVKTLTTQYSITGGGLVKGGGNLSANRSLYVEEATMPDMDAATTGDKAVTPRRFAYRLSRWWDTVCSATAQAITGQWTFTGEPRSTAPLSGNGAQLLNSDQVASLVWLQMGALPGSDLTTNPRRYVTMRALSYCIGKAVAPNGTNIIDGWLTDLTPGDYRPVCNIQYEGPLVNSPNIVGKTSAIGICPYNLDSVIFANNTAGTIAGRVGSGYASAADLDGRQVYIGFGTLPVGGDSLVQKGQLGFGWGGDSDFVRLWNGSSWEDTTFRWKTSTELLQGKWEFQFIALAYGGIYLQIRPCNVNYYTSNASTSPWQTICTVPSFTGWNPTFSFLLATECVSTPSPVHHSCSQLAVKRLHYACGF